MLNKLGPSAMELDVAKLSYQKKYKTEITIGSYYNHKGVWNFSKSSYAFVPEEVRYNLSSTDLYTLWKESKFPLILDWPLGIHHVWRLKLT